MITSYSSEQTWQLYLLDEINYLLDYNYDIDYHIKDDEC